MQIVVTFLLRVAAAVLRIGSPDRRAVGGADESVLGVFGRDTWVPVPELTSPVPLDERPGPAGPVGDPVPVRPVESVVYVPGRAAVPDPPLRFNPLYLGHVARASGAR